MSVDLTVEIKRSKRFVADQLERLAVGHEAAFQLNDDKDRSVVTRRALAIDGIRRDELWVALRALDPGGPKKKKRDRARPRKLIVALADRIKISVPKIGISEVGDYLSTVEASLRETARDMVGKRGRQAKPVWYWVVISAFLRSQGLKDDDLTRLVLEARHAWRRTPCPEFLKQYRESDSEAGKRLKDYLRVIRHEHKGKELPLAFLFWNPLANV